MTHATNGVLIALTPIIRTTIDVDVRERLDAAIYKVNNASHFILNSLISYLGRK